MGRVFGCPRAGAQDEVVARTLALVAKPARRDPGEGMEPVERARDPGDQVCGEVAAPDVCQLVEEDGFAALLGPLDRKSVV